MLALIYCRHFVEFIFPIYIISIKTPSSLFRINHVIRQCLIPQNGLRILCSSISYKASSLERAFAGNACPESYQVQTKATDVWSLLKCNKRMLNKCKIIWKNSKLNVIFFKQIVSNWKLYCDYFVRAIVLNKVLSI